MENEDLIKKISDLEEENRRLAAQLSSGDFNEIVNSTVAELCPSAYVIARFPSGEIVRYNRNFIEYFNLPPEGVTGSNLVELGLISGEDRAHVLEKITPGDKHKLQISVKRKDGIEITVDASIILFDFNGETFSLTGINNITPLKSIEKQLMEREAFFRDIAESMSDIIWEIDSEWRYTYVAGKLEKYTGYNPDSLIGITPFDLMSKSEAEDFLKVLKDASSDLRPITDVEATVKTMNGIDSTFLVNGVPVIKDGKFAGYRGVVREITDRKRIERVLLENERNLSTMMSNLPGMAYRCRNDEFWTMEFISNGFIPLTGYLPDEVMYNNVISYAELIHEDDREMVRNAVDKALENRSRFESTYRIRCADNNYKWVLEKGNGVFDDGGDLLYLQGFITDITERIQIEEKIRLSEERMRILFEKNPQGLLLADRDGNIVSVNNSWLRMFGYSESDVPGLQILDIRPQSQYETANELLRSLFSCEVISHHVEGLFLKKNGDEFWCDLSAGLITDPISGENYALGVYIDIDERKQMERALAESELKNRILLEKSPLGISLIRDGKIIFGNAAYARIFGYNSASEVVGMMLPDLLAPDQREYLSARQTSRQKGETPPESFEAQGVKKNGEIFPFYIDVVGIELNDGPATLGFIQDITERKRNEAALQRFQNELENLVAERTGEIMKLNRMVMNSQEEERQRIAKDLHDGVGQTILAAKFAFSSFMKNGMSEKDSFERGMLLIDMSSQELREVYSGLYPSMLRELGLGAAVKWCVRNYLDSAGINVEFSVKIESEVPHEIAINIYRIIQELFNNIVKHSGASNASVLIYDDCGKIIIAVEDDGIGFNPESVKGNAAGSGLFNIGQRIALLKGRINVDSVAGLTFVKIEIPLENR